MRYQIDEVIRTFNDRKQYEEVGKQTISLACPKCGEDAGDVEPDARLERTRCKACGFAARAQDFALTRFG